MSALSRVDSLGGRRMEGGLWKKIEDYEMEMRRRVEESDQDGLRTFRGFGGIETDRRAF